MIEIFPLGISGNAVYFDEIPPPLEAALEVMPRNATTARLLVTVLASNPDCVLGPAELLDGMREINPSIKPAHADSYRQCLIKTLAALETQGVVLPIVREPTTKQPLNGTSPVKRLGWVWRRTNNSNGDRV